MFNCVARLWLNRMTQFKEKAGKDRENASIRIYDYPVLMAADMRQGALPVSQEGKQHLELGRDIAQKLDDASPNPQPPTAMVTQFFLLPEPVTPGPATRIMSPTRRHQENVEVGSVGLFAHRLSPTTPTPSPEVRKANTNAEPLH